MSSTTETRSDYSLGTIVCALTLLVESLLTVGLIYRALIHLLTYNALVGEPGAGNESWVVGIESAFAVRGHDLEVSEELLARSLSLVFAGMCLVVLGSRLDGGPLVTLYAGANWLVLALDPLVGLYARA